jgi:hypothetical protein
MAWFYNKLSGELTSASGVDELPYLAAIHLPGDWYELKIPASDTAAQAAAAAVAEHPGGTAPTTSLVKGLTNIPPAAVSAAGQDILGLPSLSNTRDLAVRVVKVVIGAAMIIIGLAQLSGASKIASNVKVLPV